MRVNRRFVFAGLAVFVLLGLVVSGVVLAQDSDQEDLGEGTIEGQAYPGPTMNYQGYVTDSGGSPLDGDYEMSFSFWDAETGGNMRWGADVQTVTVSDGLFSVVLGDATPIDPSVLFDKQLYMEVEVESTPLPRQPLRAVPYAMGLVAGSTVIGPTGTDPALYVRNTDGDEGIYSVDLIGSGRGFTGPSTHVWLPLLNAFLNPSDVLDFGFTPGIFGAWHITRTDPVKTNAKVWIPVQAEEPFGRDLRIDFVRICYKSLDGGGTDPYITNVYLRGRDYSSGTVLTYASYSTNEGSTTYDCFDVDMTMATEINANRGPAVLIVDIYFPSNGDQFDLYGAKLVLNSTY